MSVLITDNSAQAQEKLLKPEEVAEWLQIQPSTLVGWRVRRKGPKFVRLGQKTVRYRKSDVEAWMMENA